MPRYAWNKAKDRLQHGSTWAKLAGLSTESYRYDSWKLHRDHAKDTHAALTTPVGQVVQGIITVIFYPVGVALGLATTAINADDRATLAAELIAATPNLDADMIYLIELETGRLYDPARPISPQAAGILGQFLQEGGDEQQVVEYLAELEKARAGGNASQFERATGAAIGPGTRP